jgi:hypothetical protein
MSLNTRLDKLLRPPRHFVRLHVHQRAGAQVVRLRLQHLLNCLMVDSKLRAGGCSMVEL